MAVCRHGGYKVFTDNSVLKIGTSNTQWHISASLSDTDILHLVSSLALRREGIEMSVLYFSLSQFFL